MYSIATNILIAIFLTHSTAAIANPSIAPGKFVDVSNYRLHVHCIEPAHGKATSLVVFEAGGGHFSLEFLETQQVLSTTSRIRSCAYDRRGLGWSEQDDKPFSISRAVSDLRQIIESERNGLPVYLVGHSLGSYILRAYSQAYSSDVSGIVYIDPSSVSVFKAYPEALSANIRDGESTPSADQILSMRDNQMANLNQVWLTKYEDKLTWINTFFTEKNLKAGDKEKAALEETLRWMETIPPSSGIKTTVISAGLPQVPDWAKFINEEYLSTIDNVRHVIANGARHHVHWTHTDLVVTEIKRISEQGNERSIDSTLP